jgi:phosphatidylinositol phospholipase C delta
MQVNEAMFVGTMGWVEKPCGIRRGGIRGEGEAGRRWLLRLWVLVLVRSSSPSLRAALSPVGHSTTTEQPHGQVFLSIHPRTLLHSSGSEQLQWLSKSVRTTHVPPQGADFVLPPDARRFEWEYESDDLAFLRLGVYEDEPGKDDLIVVFCARLDSGCEDDR